MISPLLANIYLHYALDNWADVWRKRTAGGNVLIVRFADDTVFGFQYHTDAEKFLAEMRIRLSRFRLELNEEKTRLIEFGRFAVTNRMRRRVGKPESFNFLGFTHICSKSRKGKFIVLRQTNRKRMRAKLKEIKTELRQRMHQPVNQVGKWLRSVVQGHYQYYAVPRNGYALKSFRYEVTRLWRHILSRRSQKGRISWERMTRYTDIWLPDPRILHPYPSQRLGVTTQGRSPVR